MAKTPKVMEGMIRAEIGIRVSEIHTSWRVLGEIELPYKVRVYLQPAPTTETEEQE